MPFCANCGTEYFNTIRFCSNCGTRIEGTPSSAVALEPSSTTPAAVQGHDELRIAQLRDALVNFNMSFGFLAMARREFAERANSVLSFWVVHEELQQLIYPLVPELNEDDIFTLLVESPETYRTTDLRQVVDFNGNFSLLTLSGIYMFEKKGEDIEPLVMQEWAMVNEDPVLEFWDWADVPGRNIVYLGNIMDTYIWGGKFDFTQTPENEYISNLVDAKRDLSNIKRIASAPVDELLIHTINFQDGAEYEGTLSNGVPSGYGTMSYPNGDTYTGGFANGVRWGFGNYRYKAGGNLNGQWLDGAPHGLCSQIFAGDYEGHRYDGSFFDGQRSGSGTYTFPNGAQQVGIFDKGVFVE